MVVIVFLMLVCMSCSGWIDLIMSLICVFGFGMSWCGVLVMGG